MNLEFAFESPRPLTASAVKRPTIDYWSDEEKGAPRSPWGPVQTLTDFRNGIINVVTSGHGGMKVTGDLAKKIPKLFRSTWYEEDCEAKIVVYYLYDELRAIADTLSEEECGRYGPLRYIKTHTKEQVRNLFLSTGHYAATYDFINKTSRNPEAAFDSDWHRKEYVERMAQLNNPPQNTSGCAVKEGQTITFEPALSFTINLEKVLVNQFIVVKIGRKVRFAPVGHGFLAQIPNWSKMAYTLS